MKDTGLKGEVELEVQGDQVVIRVANRPRLGWAEAFSRMASRGDDGLLDPFEPTNWDESQWTSSW